MANKNNLTQYVSWILENFGKILAEAKETRKFNYQLIGWQKGKNIAEDRLVVKIVGTNTNVPLTPLEIYEDDQLVNGFSPADVKIIATLAVSVKCAPKYKLLLQDFRGNLDSYVIVYGEKGTSKKFRATVDDLAKNMKLITEFSQEDAFKIGKAFAENQVRKERKLMDMLKLIKINKQKNF